MPTPGTATPTTVDLIVEAHTKTFIQGFIEHTFYVNGQEYKELPLDANVREPDTNKSQPYKEMLKTLNECPEDFLENNLGISVISNRVEEKSQNKYTLTFESGTGILNGGHTQLAILNTKTNPNTSKAIVRLTVREKNYSPKRIAEIASAQNSTTSVKSYTLAEKKGLFATLRNYIDPDINKHIIWYEGKKVPNGIGLEPNDLISIINLFNIKSHESPYSSSTTQPNASSNAKGTVFKKWEEDPSAFEIVYPLVNDIILFMEYIQIKFHEKTGLTKFQVIQDAKNNSQKPLVFSGKIPEYIIPRQFLFPILAAFRANIYYDDVNKKIGWYVDNEKLFDKEYKDLFKQLSNAYSNAWSNNLNKASRDTNTWKLLYITLKNRISTTGVFKTYDI